MNLKNQSGFAVLTFSVAMAVIMAGIFFFASTRVEQISDRYSVSQSVSYANEMSVKFAQRIRWSYDVARADDANAGLNLCAGEYGGAIQTIGALRFCIVANRICVRHPQSDQVPVCISPGGSNPSLVAESWRLDHARKWNSFVAWSRLITSSAEAQTRWSPPPPAAGITTNSLTVSNTVCIGGECRARCNVNADCVTFKFCPLVSQACTEDQIVWQTIALIR